MITASILRETHEIENLVAFMDAFPGLMEDELTTRFNTRIKPRLLSELRYTPRAAALPFTFGSEKSRRWYHAAVREGRIPTSGGRYQRTGNMVAGWEVNIFFGDGAVALEVKNRSKALPYVTGKRQVAGHRITGWPQHNETIAFWRDAAGEEVDAAINALINRR